MDERINPTERKDLRLLANVFLTDVESELGRRELRFYLRAIRTAFEVVSPDLGVHEVRPWHYGQIRKRFKRIEPPARAVRDIKRVERMFDSSWEYGLTLFTIPKDRLALTKNAMRKSISAKKRIAVLKRDAFTCRYCGTCHGDADGLDVDHVVPWNIGGTDDESNLVAACASCNRSLSSNKKHEPIPLKEILR